MSRYAALFDRLAQRGEEAIERADVVVGRRCCEGFLDAVIARDHPGVDAPHVRGTRRGTGIRGCALVLACAAFAPALEPGVGRVGRRAG